jgi:hypothetical protein
MIIVQLNQGMGNQMFQYACGKALARKFKTKLVLDTRSFLNINPILIQRTYSLNRFHITEQLFDDIPEESLPEDIYLVSEEKWFQYGGELMEEAGKESYLIGFWQSWKYFEGIESLLRKKFRVRPEYISPQNTLLGETMRQSDSISIHVRRTDYLLLRHSHIGALPVDYYTKAVSYLTERVSNPIFYVFSDDPDWAEEHIATPSQAHFIRGNTDIEDLYLMSQCRHNIIANSSFSWWGGWLNEFPEKIVIVPQKWFIGAGIDIKDIDLIPPGWISIDF